MAPRRALPILLIGLLLFVARGGALAQGEGPASPAAPQAPAVGAALPGTGFTYQGELHSAGQLVNATCDFQFSLWDAAAAGTQLGGLHTKANVPVADGRFTVVLNDAGQFGPGAFTGEARWLRIAVRCPAGGGGYTTLAPRQPLTAAPLAFALPGLRTEQTITSTNLIGGHISNTMGVGVFGATIGGGGAAGQPNSVLNNYDTIGGGLNNTTNGTRATVGGGDGNSAIGSRSTVGGGEANTASGGRATVGGGHSNVASGTGATVGGGGWNGTVADGNVAAGVASTIGGGYGNVISPTADFGTVSGGKDNTASGLSATVGGGSNNTASSQDATVGGGAGNDATGVWSTVGGGGSNAASGTYATAGGGSGNTASFSYATVGGGAGNDASGHSATVGGGTGNTASDSVATVAGGRDNTASGPGATVGGGGWNGSVENGNAAAGDASTIGGGYANDITAAGDYATVGGGYNNTASGDNATVGGGYLNTASGTATTVGGGESNEAVGAYGTVGGGRYNSASGNYSFAAGRFALALHTGAFVWSSSETTPISSTASNQFLVRATGGISLTTNIGGTTGCRLSAGGGTWDCTSDRNAKANFAPVDGVAILNTLAALPIETWNFNTQDASIRHIGPMAQDFYAAFGLGEGDTTISAVDADGVALAAIQGLYTVVQAKDAELAALRDANTTQQDELAALQDSNAALSERVAALEGETSARRDWAGRDVSTGGYGQLLLGLLLGAGIAGGAFALGRRASPRSR